jgi:hypothetical protein
MRPKSRCIWLSRVLHRVFVQRKTAHFSPYFAQAGLNKTTLVKVARTRIDAMQCHYSYQGFLDGAQCVAYVPSLRIASGTLVASHFDVHSDALQYFRCRAANQTGNSAVLAATRIVASQPLLHCYSRRLTA